MKDREIETLIVLAYYSYKAGKDSRKYNDPNDIIPQSIIKLYYSKESIASFSNIIENFKERYIYNENELERVKDPLERDGLECLYDYIQSGAWKEIDNIFLITRLHKILYSKVTYPEFGGVTRKVNTLVTDGGDNIAIDWSLITKEILKLNPIYDSLSKMAKEINETKDKTKLIPYIDKCLDLKCDFIRIHPFPDGNGRTSRALFNIFLKKVNLPPTYVEVTERDDYIHAMDQAVRCNNPTEIRNFYYYKICDSIYELDITMRPNSENIYVETKSKGGK